MANYIILSYRSVLARVALENNRLTNRKATTAHQIVVWPDAKQLSEVAEGNRGVGFKPEVWVMVGRCEVAAFTGWKTGS